MLWYTRVSWPIVQNPERRTRNAAQEYRRGSDLVQHVALACGYIDDYEERFVGAAPVPSDEVMRCLMHLRITLKTGQPSDPPPLDGPSTSRSQPGNSKRRR